MKLIVLFDLIFLLLITNLTFCQNFEFKKLLFNKQIQRDKLEIDSVLKGLPDIFFFKNNIDSIFGFYTKASKNSPISIGEKQGSFLVLYYHDRTNLEAQQLRMDSAVIRNYFMFNDSFTYKDYSRFVSSGLIMAIECVTNKMLLIRIHSCVYEEQKKYVINHLKENGNYKIYEFNCGGDKIIQKEL